MNFIKLSRRHLAISLTTMMLAAPAFSAPQQAGMTQKEKLSYSIGADIGENFRKQGIEIDTKVFMKGLNDAFGSKKLMLQSSEMEEAIKTFQKDMLKKKAEAFKRQAAENKQKGVDFLKQNK